jgi:hypothetical protein
MGHAAWDGLILTLSIRIFILARARREVYTAVWAGKGGYMM